MSKKILIGLSGGVDSSAAALILKSKGYDVTGCTLELTAHPADITAAKSVCGRLGIEHYTFDFRERFENEVLKSFAAGYINGLTPNPCVECNRNIKFAALLQKAEEMGFDGIATGHYAGVEYDEKAGRWLLKRGVDRKKDQSYVLCRLTQEQLSKALFPLWGKSKAEVREIALEHGLVNAQKADSMDICFIPDGDYAGFIERYTGREFPRGDFLDVNGYIIGGHNGIIRYTVGQRKGLGMAFGKPMYVCSKDAQNNTVTLGDEENLFKREVYAENFNLISVSEIGQGIKATAKIRYNTADSPCVIEPHGENGVKAVFAHPQRAPAKGQYLVVYDGENVIGGGVIVDN